MTRGIHHDFLAPDQTHTHTVRVKPPSHRFSLVCVCVCIRSNHQIINMSAPKPAAEELYVYICDDPEMNARARKSWLHQWRAVNQPQIQVISELPQRPSNILNAPRTTAPARFAIFSCLSRVIIFFSDFCPSFMRDRCAVPFFLRKHHILQHNKAAAPYVE